MPKNVYFYFVSIVHKDSPIVQQILKSADIVFQYEWH